MSIRGGDRGREGGREEAGNSVGESGAGLFTLYCRRKANRKQGLDGQTARVIYGVVRQNEQSPAAGRAMQIDSADDDEMTLAQRPY